jgi:hypothetical protein
VIVGHLSSYRPSLVLQHPAHTSAITVLPVRVPGAAERRLGLVEAIGHPAVRALRS